MPDSVNRITSAALNRILRGELRKPMSCFVKFYSNRCPYCKRLKPLFDSVAADNQEEAYFYAFNIDDDLGVPSRIGFRGVPTIAHINALPPVSIEVLSDPVQPHEDLWYHPQDVADFIKRKMDE